MINRLLAPQSLMKHAKSILLLGPRQVGKSTLMKSCRPDLSFNLADENTFSDFVTHPNFLRTTIESGNHKLIFIDEIQRYPRLLNTIQSLVDENSKLKFLMTGSSARKLRRGKANLLPGRLFTYQLGPFVSKEFNYQLDSNQYLKFGGLPEAYLGKNESFIKKLLKSYVGTYLKEEIQAESLVRNIEQFSRFLLFAGNHSGQFVDYSKISRSAKISRLSVPRFFEILEDTLLGFRLFPDPDLIEKADLVKHPKFFLFDNGVYNQLQGNFELSNDRIGRLNEHLITNQIRYTAWGLDEDIELSTFRTRGGLEIDLIVKYQNQKFAIEIKNSDHLSASDLTSLDQMKNYLPKSKRFIFHMGKKRLKINQTWCLPWQEGLKEMGL
jgi:predicted AAA+ superfamily ATPase